MVTPTGSLARVLVLARHGRDEAVEAGFSRELRVERGRHDVSLAYGDDPAVVEAGEDVDVRPGPLDDRRPDEDAVDRLIAKHGNGQVGLERIELTPEGVALDGHIEQRQDRRFAAGDLAGKDDHARACPEERCAARGQVEDRLAKSPALDQLTHRGAFAAGQDQAGNIVEIARQAHRNALDADRGKGPEVLPEGALKREYTDPHDSATSAVNRQPLSEAGG